MASQPAWVLSLGSINADFQVRIQRRPEVSETLIGEDFVRLGGGKAANVAYLARRMNVEVHLFGHLGRDDLAEQALKGLREQGVNLNGLKQLEGQSTGVAMITVPPGGKKGIVLSPNANQVWSENDLGPLFEAVQAAPPSSVLVVDCEVPVWVVEKAADAAKKRSVRVILDPSPASAVTDRLLRACDFILPNPSEAEQLVDCKPSDVDSARRAGERLLDRGVGAACVKLSDGGCVLVERSGAQQVAPVPTEVEDTTGAGDAFAGGLAVALSEGRTPGEAVCFAVACSHFLVGRYGSQVGALSREAIDSIAARLYIRAL